MMISLRGTDMKFGKPDEKGNYSVMSGGSDKQVSSFEILTYSLALNEIFKDDEELKELIPINPEDPNTLFDLFSNGIALCHLCLLIDPECGLLKKAIYYEKNLSVY